MKLKDMPRPDNVNGYENPISCMMCLFSMIRLLDADIMAMETMMIDVFFRILLVPFL